MSRSRTLPRQVGLLAVGGCLALGACRAGAPVPTGAGSVPHQVVHASASCGADTASVNALASAAELHRTQPSRTVVPAAPVGGPGAAGVDFERSLVLRVSMGQQPNAGSQLALTGVRSDPAGGQLLVDVRWSEPEPGRMYAAVITRPCVVVSVPRQSWRGVRVVDQHGRERARLSLPPRPTGS